MTDSKAPLPDEVEEVIKRVGYLDALYGYNYAETIRAHIAAQAEKNATLENDAGEKQREVNKWQAKYWALEAENFKLSAGQCPIAGGLVGDDHGHQYCKLEADNKLLREALEALEAVQNGPPLIRYKEQWESAMNLTSEALAQTEQKS